MKKLITIIFFTSLVNGATAQLDTLAYLKTFEQQKAQYIGQPFSVLLTAMGQVQPKSVWGAGILETKTKYLTQTFILLIRIIDSRIQV